MPLVPMFPANALAPLLKYVAEREGRPERVFGAISARVQVEHALIPLAVGGLSFERAVQRLGPDVGFRAGAAARPEQVGPFGRHLLASLTLGSAVEQLVRNGGRFNTGQQFWLDLHGREVHLHRRHARALRRGRSAASDYALMCVLSLFRLAAGSGWRPSELRFEGPPPAHAEELAALASRSVSFESEQTTLVFPQELLALPLPDSTGSARFASDEAMPAREPIASLRQAIAALMQIGGVDVHEAAAAAGHSVRSFQRRLAAHGLSFDHLLQQERFRAARQLLADRDAKVIDVAARLGYSDSANFTRAFRRWAGLSPQAFRRATVGLAD